MSPHPESTETAELGRTEYLFLRFQTEANDADFTELYRRKHAELLAYVSRNLGSYLASRVEVEDIVQETFIEAFRYRQHFEAGCSRAFTRFVTRIAQRRILTHFRSQTALRRVPDGKLFSIDTPAHDADQDDPLEVAETAPGPVSRVAAADVFQLFDRCTAQLTEEQAQLVRMRLLDDASYEELAAAFGISVGAARMRFLRTCVRLRDLFERFGPELARSA